MTARTSRKTRYALLGAAAIAGLAVVVMLGRAAFVADSQPIASVGAVDMSNYDISGGGSIIYRGDYIRSTWDGDLVAYDVNSVGATSIRWRARERLTALGWTNRKIATFGATAGVPFRWTNLTTTQQTALGNATTGPQILDYLRGDTSREVSATNTATTAFRQRYSMMGAVIHGRPYYRNHNPNGTAIGRVYVGTNYGMLHAFDAFTGDELWAYVPSMLIPKMESLANRYATTFPYLVDGQLAIADVPITGGTRTQLVGGLGGGAKGLYSLNISTTSPSSESAVASMAMWEITSATTGFGNLGNTYAAPQIVKLNSNSGAWAVLMPNGPNGGTGEGSSLFVINASTGALIAEIPAGTGPNNGLGGIAAVDTDRNGTVDVVFAGDLKGTLWRFDLSSTSGLPTSATAVFTPAAGTERPITAAPSVIASPQGGLFVNFGTGKVYEAGDLTSTTTEYLYGIRINAASTGTIVTPTLTQVGATNNQGLSTQYRTSTIATAVNYASGDRGWRISLPTGERLLDHNTLTDAGRYVVTTTVPNAGSTQGAWLMQVDALTGTSPSAPFFDVDGDGVISLTGTQDLVNVSGTTYIPIGKFLGGGVWSQPVLARLSPTLDLPYFNFNANTELTGYQTTVIPGSGGIAGGHFDVDIYFGCGSNYPNKDNCKTQDHTHEYDDKFNVVGVEMLNASDTAYNLSNAIASTSTTFKILVANTNWSPAARLKVRWQGISGVTDGAYSDSIGEGRYVWDLPLSPDGFLAATPGGAALTFSRTTLRSLQFYLPLDAFTNREWRPGSGDIRAGLIPTQTGCVRDAEGSTGSKGTDPWNNGALTVLLVNSTASGANVDDAGPTTASTKFGSAAGGYRVKRNTAAYGMILAQYTYFWHHPNGNCLQDTAWVKNPPADTSAPSTKFSTKAPGSADPTGSFIIDSTGTGTIGTTTTVMTYNGVTVIVTRTFSSAGVTQTIRRASDNAVLDTSLSPFGQIAQSGPQLTLRPRIGRLGWRELLR